MSGSGKALKTTFDAAARALHVSVPDVSGATELRVGEEKPD